MLRSVTLLFVLLIALTTFPFLLYLSIPNIATVLSATPAAAQDPESAPSIPQRTPSGDDKAPLLQAQETSNLAQGLSSGLNASNNEKETGVKAAPMPDVQYLVPYEEDYYEEVVGPDGIRQKRPMSRTVFLPRHRQLGGTEGLSDEERAGEEAVSMLAAELRATDDATERSELREQLEQQLRQLLQLQQQRWTKKLDELLRQVEELKTLQQERGDREDEIIARRTAQLLEEPDPLDWNPFVPGAASGPSNPRLDSPGPGVIDRGNLGDENPADARSLSQDSSGQTPPGGSRLPGPDGLPDNRPAGLATPPASIDESTGVGRSTDSSPGLSQDRKTRLNAIFADESQTGGSAESLIVALQETASKWLEAEMSRQDLEGRVDAMQKLVGAKAITQSELARFQRELRTKRSLAEMFKIAFVQFQKKAGGNVELAAANVSSQNELVASIKESFLQGLVPSTDMIEAKAKLRMAEHNLLQHQETVEAAQQIREQVEDSIGDLPTADDSSPAAPERSSSF